MLKLYSKKNKRLYIEYKTFLKSKYKKILYIIFYLDTNHA